MLKLRPLAYKTHPYNWPTIGKDIQHIEKVTLDTLKDFFYSHYAPNNAILAIAGNITSARCLELAEKWFAPLERRKLKPRNLPPEPEQTEERRDSVYREVPADMIYKAWHVCGRSGSDFAVLDLLTDILAGGESGRLYTSLVRDKKLFSDINAYLGGEIDPGLLFLTGKLMDGVSMEKAEAEIQKIIDDLKTELVPENEIEKVKNKFESSTVFANTSILNKALNLAFYELLGDASAVNKEVEIYRSIKPEMVAETARKYLTTGNCNTIYYKGEK
jgi:predicted Zn-dependent peptidase